MTPTAPAVREVLHVLPDLAVGGGQRLVEWMCRAQPQGGALWHHRVLALAGGPLADAFPDTDLEVISGDASQQRMVAAIARTAPAVVHVHTPEQWSLASAVRHDLGTPVVSTFHGLTEPTPTISLALADWRLLAQIARVPVRRLRFSRSGCVHTAVSSAAARLHAAKVGLDAGHIPVIHPGLPEATFTSVSDRSGTRREWDVQDGTPVVTVVGSLTEAKGSTDLPGILEQLVQRRPDAVIVVAGSGPARLDIERGINHAGLAGSVRFLGQVDDIVRVLDAGDVHLTTSRSESFGLGVLEAMARQRPVIGYHTPGFDDFFVPGAGQLITGFEQRELAELIAIWVGDIDRCKRAGHVGRKRALDFPIENTRAGFEAVYESTVNGQRRAPGR